MDVLELLNRQTALYIRPRGKEDRPHLGHLRRIEAVIALLWTSRPRRTLWIGYSYAYPLLREYNQIPDPVTA